MGWVGTEKEALVATLRATDPDGSTLCQGWDTKRLLAHLVQREHAGLASISDAIARKPPGQEPGLSRLTDAASDAAGYQALVDRFEAGPPRWSPMSWASEQINLVEYAIHHEDVRRGGPEPVEPRALSAGEEQAIWKQLPLFSRVAFRSSPVGVTLADGAGRTLMARKGSGVVITGGAVEQALYVSGRRAAARVEITGDPTALEKFARWTATR